MQVSIPFDPETCDELRMKKFNSEKWLSDGKPYRQEISDDV